MADIIHALSQLPFVAGFTVAAVIFFFLGLAIGWSKGRMSGWDDGWDESQRANRYGRGDVT